MLYQLSYARIKILVESTKSFGPRQRNLATRGLQSRSTCLANMERHLLSEVAHAVSTDFNPAGVRFIISSYQRLPTFYNSSFETPSHPVRSTNLFT